MVSESGSTSLISDDGEEGPAGRGPSMAEQIAAVPGKLVNGTAGFVGAAISKSANMLGAGLNAAVMAAMGMQPSSNAPRRQDADSRPKDDKRREQSAEPGQDALSGEALEATPAPAHRAPGPFTNPLGGAKTASVDNAMAKLTQHLETGTQALKAVSPKHAVAAEAVATIRAQSNPSPAEPAPTASRSIAASAAPRLPAPGGAGGRP